MFLLPLLQGVQRNPFKQTVVSHPFPEWRKVSNNVCTRVTLMGLLDTPDGTAERSHGLWTAKAMTKQSCESKIIHWLCYSTDIIHTARKTDPLYSRTRTCAFPLYICTKSHLSLTLECNSPTEQTGQQEFCFHSQSPCCCPWEQRFLFVSLWICEKTTLSTTS